MKKWRRWKNKLHTSTRRVGRVTDGGLERGLADSPQDTRTMSLDPTPSRVARRGRDPAAYVLCSAEMDQADVFSGVYYKLGFFSVALFVAPISAYYLAKDRWLGGAYTPPTSLLTHARRRRICGWYCGPCRKPRLGRVHCHRLLRR